MLKELILNALAKAAKNLADVTGRLAESVPQEPAPVVVDSDHPQLVIKQEQLKHFSDMYSVVRGYRPEADMRSVVIPEGIVGLDRGCFAKCHTLEEVYIPDSVTFMDGNVFFECRALRKVRLSASVTEIPFWGFRDCGSLKELEIPRKVHRIGFCAFWGSGIERIVLPEGVEAIQLSAFALCRSLSCISLPSTLKEIEDSVFESTESLTQVTLPDGLRSLGERTFWLSGLTGINIPPRLAELKKRTFRECRRLSTIYIPDNIRLVDSEAFMDCTALETVRLPWGVTVDDTVFENCGSLSSFTVGDITVHTDEAVKSVPAGTLTVFLVRTINSGRFLPAPEEAKALTELYLTDIAFQLEKYGVAGAAEYVGRDIGRSLAHIASLDRPEAFGELVGRGARLTPEQTDMYIEAAINAERHEMYISLLRYKRDILGFEVSEDSESRFEL